jgi:adenine C2-methylase RlmN of 23S rRNA A2503 and tRNA A37
LLKILNPRHASVVWNYLIQNPEITQISEIPLNKWSIRDEVKHLIEEKYVYTTSKIVEVFESSRGDTIKLLIELFDGNRIETVIMKHHKRTTVCLSSQVGCQMGCKFCATGTMGIICDLYSNEIIEQLVFANQFSDIRNVVFMGMGEPLNNYDNVKNSIEFMIDSKHFSLCKWVYFCF